ncbi:hypothetical protein B0I73DRAFT_161209 [Yarrowia lipolytica]|nr:hypothetical protein B0I73DRAFT_161209 [Yarrowia lipolytica]
MIEEINLRTPTGSYTELNQLGTSPLVVLSKSRRPPLLPSRLQLSGKNETSRPSSPHLWTHQMPFTTATCL